MSLSIEYKGKKVAFSFTVARHHLLVSLMLLATCLIAAIYFSKPLEMQIQQRIVQTKQDFQDQRQELNQVKQKTRSEIAALVLKVGEMQGQVRRLNALGERLAGVASLEKGEFDFSEDVPVGGYGYEADTEAVVSSNDLLAEMNSLMLELEEKENQMEVLESLILSHNIVEDSSMYGRPIKTGWLSSYYGVRKDPFNGLPAMHKGVDFAGIMNQEVFATGAGVVTWAGRRFGYGKMIEIDHGGGYKSRYAHNNKLLVRLGDVVTRGQAVSLMGTSGRSTGPHVHYEVIKNGKQIDPLSYIYRQPKS